jgi:CHAT domain-containing protein
MPSYLVKRFGISYQLSASMFHSSLQQPPLKKAGTYSFIGFAPVFSPDSANSHLTARNITILNTITNDEQSLRSVSVNGKFLNELPYSEMEIEEIITLFNNKNLPAIGYFHSFANEGAFRREAGKYSFIHLSTHGLTNETYPALSGLIFSPANVSGDTSTVSQALLAPDDDGILTASDLYGLDLSADLAVLSACESGIGKLVRGEGLISMSRGFFFSGVPNIIYSLWKVGDKSTRELMVNFYSGILNGKSFNRALQESKLKMIYNNNYAYPLYWGGFVLVGTQ